MTKNSKCLKCGAVYPEDLGLCLQCGAPCIVYEVEPKKLSKSSPAPSPPPPPPLEDRWLKRFKEIDRILYDTSIDDSTKISNIRKIIEKYYHRKC